MKDGIAGGWAYALKNIEFIAKLNPSTKFEVVFSHAKEFGEVPPLPNYSNVKFHIYLESKSNLGLAFPDQPSSQHGGLLNFALAQHVLNTHYFAVLDPDCYLLQYNTFDRLINHMSIEGLDIIGVSYPSTLPKAYYWDFPTAYFQLMNSLTCPPVNLNFLPDESKFVIDERQPGGAGVPSTGTIKVIFKLPKFFKRLVIRILRVTSRRYDSISIFLTHLPLNRPYRNLDLFHDTGWLNRKSLEKSKTEVIPHLVSIKKISSHFDANQYLLNNNDVLSSGIDPTWHFLSNGIYENRSFGKQNWWYSLLIKSLRKSDFDPAIYPATSLVSGESLFKSIGKPVNWGNMERAFEYHWKGLPFCLHLGHSGKSTKSEDMFKLDVLENHLVSKMEESYER
jgi:hypothetical protein